MPRISDGARKFLGGFVGGPTCTYLYALSSHFLTRLPAPYIPSTAMVSANNSVDESDEPIVQNDSNAHTHDKVANFSSPSKIAVLHDDDHFTMHRNTAVIADILFDHVRVFCYIFTDKANHEEKAKRVKATWAKRCNKFLFFSSEENEFLPAVKLEGVEEGKEHLWARTKAAHKYAYEHHLNEFDWFLKADDETLFVLENLRLILLSHTPEEPVYFGCRFKTIVKPKWNISGGAGYVLSRDALRRFVERALPDGKRCSQAQDGSEAAEMGRCLENVGVKAGDGRDAGSTCRFLPFVPIRGHADAGIWFCSYRQTSDYGIRQEETRSRDYAITFNYVSPDIMNLLYHLIYHVRPYGIETAFSLATTKHLTNMTHEEVLSLSRTLSHRLKSTDDEERDALSNHTLPPSGSILPVNLKT